MKPHDVSMDRYGEMVLRCACGRFLKVPKLEPAALTAHLDAHKKANVTRKDLTQVADPVANAKYLKALADAGIAET